MNTYIEVIGSITVYNKATGERKHLNENNRDQVFADLPELFDYLENQNKFRKWLKPNETEGVIVDLTK